MKPILILSIGLAIIIGACFIFNKLAPDMPKGKTEGKTEARAFTAKTNPTLEPTLNPTPKPALMPSIESTAVPTKAEEVPDEDFKFHVELPHPDNSQQVGEPNPETDGIIDIDIFFTNMESIDRAGLLPLTAWEKIIEKTQRYLRYNGISVEEIQGIEDTAKKEGSIISFETTFPEIPGSVFRILYDTDRKDFFYELTGVPFSEMDPGTESEKHDKKPE